MTFDPPEPTATEGRIGDSMQSAFTHGRLDEEYGVWLLRRDPLDVMRRMNETWGQIRFSYNEVANHFTITHLPPGERFRRIVETKWVGATYRTVLATVTGDLSDEFLAEQIEAALEPPDQPYWPEGREE